MNAIDLLKADHDRVEALFKKFKDNENGSNGPLFRRIRDELETHTHIEETIFYPAAMKRGKADLKKMIREGLEEHKQVKRLLAELGKMTPRNKQYNAKLTVVVENVEHHVEEEESDMFPLYKDQFSDTQLDKLGAEMQAEKARFQKANGIKPPREDKPSASIVDKALAAVSGLFTGSSEPKEANGRARAAKANGKSNGKPSVARAKGRSSKTTSAKSKRASSKKPAPKSTTSKATGKQTRARAR